MWVRLGQQPWILNLPFRDEVVFTPKVNNSLNDTSPKSLSGKTPFTHLIMVQSLSRVFLSSNSILMVIILLSNSPLIPQWSQYFFLNPIDIFLALLPLLA